MCAGFVCLIVAFYFSGLKIPYLCSYNVKIKRLSMLRFILLTFFLVSLFYLL
jgi:hypothetical protein